MGNLILPRKVLKKEQKKDTSQCLIDAKYRKSVFIQV